MGVEKVDNLILFGLLSHTRRSQVQRLRWKNQAFLIVAHLHSLSPK